LFGGRDGGCGKHEALSASSLHRFGQEGWGYKIKPACKNQETREITMPKFVIERDIPEAGSLSSEQLQAISKTSRGILREMGPEIQWVESYVTDNRVYCVYVAPDEEAVRKHAEQAGFPANRISQVRSVIDPTTAD
jgi:hypothetical protein